MVDFTVPFEMIEKEKLWLVLQALTSLTTNAR